VHRSRGFQINVKNGAARDKCADRPTTDLSTAAEASTVSYRLGTLRVDVRDDRAVDSVITVLREGHGVGAVTTGGAGTRQ
jgi:hypothetical protein